MNSLTNIGGIEIKVLEATNNNKKSSLVGKTIKLGILCFTYSDCNVYENILIKGKEYQCIQRENGIHLVKKGNGIHINGWVKPFQK